jgi:peptide deformylase
MAVRDIVLMGDSFLRERSAEIKVEHIQDSEFQKLVADMIETAQLNPEEGFITAGLAAPQVGEHVRVFLTIRKGSPRKHPTYDVHINPQLEFPSTEMRESEESCLSTPGLCGVVSRYSQVRISYLDEHGERHREKLTGDPAIFVQHENDHLDGILWVDRVADTKTLRYC